MAEVQSNRPKIAVRNTIRPRWLGPHIELSDPPGRLKVPRPKRLAAYKGTGPLGVPYVDGWRLFVEYEGHLLGPEGGERFIPGRRASCRYDETHVPPQYGCTCGYYVARYPLELHTFFKPGVPGFRRTRGVVLNWSREDQREKAFPVFAAVRLFDPWVSFGVRGSRMELTGPAYAVSAESAQRLVPLGLSAEVVEDIEVLAMSILEPSDVEP